MSEMYKPRPEDFKKAELLISDKQGEMTEGRELKRERLNEIKRRIDETSDSLGLEIDSGIKETVVFLNALGLPTSQSCEGHLSEGLPWPWINIATPNEPDERWQDQGKIFARIAIEKNVSLEDLKKGEPLQLWHHAIKSASQKPETNEYQAWQKENKFLNQRVGNLLEQFYEDRNTEEINKLRLNGNSLEPENGDTSTKILDGSLTTEEIKNLQQGLPERQREMRDFTQFLEEKYWK